MNCWLRAADYYRSAAFWLLPDDPRRLATFDKCERASQKWLRYMGGELVAIPYEKGVSMPAYFIKPKHRGADGRRAGAGRDAQAAQGAHALRLRGAGGDAASIFCRREVTLTASASP
jgi:hypothetical protein